VVLQGSGITITYMGGVHYYYVHIQQGVPMCMYACMYVCICIDVYVYVLMYMYVCICIDVCVCMASLTARD
jgi:hypothetical protein